MSLALHSKDSKLKDHLNDTDLALEPDGTSYLVHVLFGDPPASGRAPNTLYTMSDGGGNNRVIWLAYRVSQPAPEAGPTGGVPLPEPSWRADEGLPTFTGEWCAPAEPPPVPVLAASLPVPASAAPLEWRLVFDPFDLSIRTHSAVLADAVAAIFETAEEGEHPRGFVDPQVTAVASRVSLAPGTVLVVRASAPAIGSQVRAYSLCLSDTLTTRSLDRVDDEVIRPDADGNFTVLLARPEDLANCGSADCGASLLWRATADAVIVYRQRLAALDFAEGIARIPAAGSEQEVMGSYLPAGKVIDAGEAYPCPVTP